MTRRRRLTIAVSPFQVVAARFFLDQENVQDADDVLLVNHPNVTENAFLKIKELAEKLDFQVVNAIPETTAFFQSIQTRPSTESRSIFHAWTHLPKSQDANIQLQNLKNKITATCGTSFDEIWMRLTHKNPERILFQFIFSENSKVTTMPESLIDGEIRDSAFSASSRRKLFMERSRVGIRTALYRTVLGIKDRETIPLTAHMLHDFAKVSRTVSLGLKKTKDQFSFSEIGDFLRSVDLAPSIDPTKRVLLLGSTLKVISMDDTIQIFNQIISRVKNQDGKMESEILFKHHPRTRPDEWQELKRRLHCDIFDYDQNYMFELQVSKSPQLQSAYGILSDSILNTKLLFGLDTHLIDIKQINNHSAFQSIYDLCRFFEVPIIEYRSL